MKSCSIMLNNIVSYSIVIVLVFANVEGNVSKLVNTESGTVKGYKNPDSGIYEFLSIPYATVPTGEHKFKPPIPVQPWMEPLEATERNIICPQAKIMGVQHHMTVQEDCLIANVYVPDTEEKNLAVVVYVHGGAFQVGFGDFVKPKELVIEHKIIAVTFNYRLGVHGFLCLGTEDIPGNAGLKDQVALLKWVKKNIANFGGNAEDVTIAGYSAGSMAIEILRLSKAAEGLFSKAIPESGGIAAASAVQIDPLNNAKWFAKNLNFTDVDDIKALENFYKKATFEQLTSDSFFTRMDSSFVFTPCIERQLEGTDTEAIIDESPIQILKKGAYKKLPLLYGFSNMEGLFRISFFDIWKDIMNVNFTNFLPSDLKFKNDEERELVAKQVKEFYFGKEPVSNDNILSYVDFFTDTIFAYPMLKAVEIEVENGHSEIYLYEYSFVDENSPFVPHTKVRGANHCSQTVAVFGGQSLGVVNTKTTTEAFNKMSAIVRQLWANFIKTGTPVPEGSPLPTWPPVSGDLAPHMTFTSGLLLQGSLLKYRTRFWDGIYDKFYKEPIPPQI